ncbi:hypothetical protein LINPERPRIM_LOCUS19389 [Linum perenne]
MGKLTNHERFAIPKPDFGHVLGLRRTRAHRHNPRRRVVNSPRCRTVVPGGSRCQNPLLHRVVSSNRDRVVEVVNGILGRANGDRDYVDSVGDGVIECGEDVLVVAAVAPAYFVDGDSRGRYGASSGALA